jgi:hypothetical protein
MDWGGRQLVDHFPLVAVCRMTVNFCRCLTPLLRLSLTFQRLSFVATGESLLEEIRELVTIVKMLYSSQWELSRAVRQIPHPGLLVSIILGLAFSFSLVLLSLRSKRKKPPVAVGSTPLLGHSLLFMRNAPKLAAVIT